MWLIWRRTRGENKLTRSWEGIWESECVLMLYANAVGLWGKHKQKEGEREREERKGEAKWAIESVKREQKAPNWVALLFPASPALLYLHVRISECSANIRIASFRPPSSQLMLSSTLVPLSIGQLFTAGCPFAPVFIWPPTCDWTRLVTSKIT